MGILHREEQSIPTKIKYADQYQTTVPIPLVPITTKIGLSPSQPRLECRRLSYFTTGDKIFAVTPLSIMTMLNSTGMSVLADYDYEVRDEFYGHLALVLQNSRTDKRGRKTNEQIHTILLSFQQQNNYHQDDILLRSQLPAIIIPYGEEGIHSSISS